MTMMITHQISDMNNQKPMRSYFFRGGAPSARLFAIVAALVFVFFISGAAHADRFSRTEKKKVLWTPGKRIVIEESKGGIEVRGVKGQDVTVEGTLTVEAKTLNDARRENPKLKLEITSDRTEIRITMARPRNWKGVKSRGDFTVTVPAGATVIVKTVSGDIRVSGVNGSVSAGAVSGDIQLRGAGGEVEARTVGGSVEMKDCAGDVLAETVSGEIDFTAANRRDGTVTLRSSSGDITVAINDLAAAVTLNSAKGDVLTDLPLDEVGGKENFLRGTVGGGGAVVKISTISGDIELGR